MSITCAACGKETILKGRCPYCTRCCRRRGHCGSRARWIGGRLMDLTAYGVGALCFLIGYLCGAMLRHA